MIYIKIWKEESNEIALETLENPVYVYAQSDNGRILRCHEVKAQGILSKDGSVLYQLHGKIPMEGTVATAMVVTAAEYAQLSATMDTQEDMEDTAPEIPEGIEETEILTRAELTRKVQELDEALELLLSEVTE